MRRYVKYPLYALAIIVVIVIGVISYFSFALPDVGDAPRLQVAVTAERVERGRYLANHVMLCADCHSERDYSLFSAPPVPGTEFAGGDVFDESMGFPGRFVSRNITPYGVGDWTDGELFRVITTGVTRDGDPIFPIMPYHSFGKLDRSDIEAVIAYLRTLKPIERSHPASEVSFPMNLIMRTMPREAALTTRPSREDRIAYGGYVVTAAGCFECHTRFEDGKFTGPRGGGGREFVFPDGSVLRSANLTPHETGIKHFTRADFIGRFKAYADSTFTFPKVKPGEFQTLMPWPMYSGMTEDDLGAIFDYLQSLEPYDNRVEKFTPPKQ